MATLCCKITRNLYSSSVIANAEHVAGGADAKALHEEEFRTWNESMSRKYHPDDYHASSSPFVRWIERRRVQSILSQLGTKQEHRILEVGVGVGTILAQIPSSHRTGFDLSTYYLSIARSRLPDEVRLIEGNAEHLTSYVPEASFDGIYCSEVLEHVQHPDVVMREMAKALASGGRIVISVPHERLIDFAKKVIHSFAWLFPRLRAYDQPNEWHLHSFSAANIRALFAGAGLRMVTLQAIPSAFLPLRYVASGVVADPKRPA